MVCTHAAYSTAMAALLRCRLPDDVHHGPRVPQRLALVREFLHPGLAHQTCAASDRAHGGLRVPRLGGDQHLDAGTGSSGRGLGHMDPRLDVGQRRRVVVSEGSGGEGHEAFPMGAVVAPVRCTRSAGESETSRPRRPPET
ncbi:hypothetical protein GCM10025876_06740 [Demequina litorisediminis]|uniref:Uncharacterized protein n=1 Tax=Demequina litorisediminis TaxID=1849022 RepID=A0ABQ6IAU3_9MICO|nr:hypothetical protein GCM10025876_06740 [Demequina litorisediminis]